MSSNLTNDDDFDASGAEFEPISKEKNDYCSSEVSVYSCDPYDPCNPDNFEPKPKISLFVKSTAFDEEEDNALFGKPSLYSWTIWEEREASKKGHSKKLSKNTVANTKKHTALNKEANK